MLMRDYRPDRWTAKLGISKLWYISAVECTSSTSVLQLRIEGGMFMLWEWTHLSHSVYPKQHQCCHRNRWKKSDWWKNVMWQGHFVLSWPYGTLSINMKCQNLGFKLCLSILIIENILKSTFMRLFLGGYDEKFTV